ncbi:RNA polymerase sigma factor [Anaerovorax odorimutans]|uniref:RNA polymerase sigma factor n=1 Tax=Anaerovorax odorimutans TaxID=109327 RepID=UPI0003F9D1CA|nr:RNA polymerase sigma factor [Anaerovorax odorimutans]
MRKKDDKKELFDLLEKELIKNSNDVQKFIYTLTYDNFAKEDILQNTMMKAYESLHRLREPSKMISWLFEIAKNETARYYNIEKKWNQWKDVDLEEVQDESAEGDVADFLAKLERKEEIVELLSKLKPKYARVLRAHYIYRISLVEIAKIFGTNYNTIKTYNNRALRDLKRLYFERMQTDEQKDK